MLDVRDITVGYGGPAVLDQVSLRVDDGEVVALLGPSGSGKSTLLRVIAGLVVPDAGHVLLDGIDITTRPTHRRGVGMVFQDEQLFPHRDVRGERGVRPPHAGPAAGARSSSGWRRSSTSSASPGSGTATSTGLSGGEAKRVALARSLAPAPRAILLDEPLTGLDRDLHDRLAAEVGRILRTAGTTALLVTHDHAEAATIADRVVSISDLGRHHPGELAVVALDADATHELRRRVLRDDDPAASVAFDGDDEAGTLHLGVMDGDSLVGVSSWYWRDFPEDPTDRDRQLRGMAVDSSRQRARRRGRAAAGGCGPGVGRRRHDDLGARPRLGPRLLRAQRLRHRR